MKLYYSWKQYDADVKKIAKLLRAKKKQFDSVWGPIRGGLPLAVCLSHILGLRYVTKPKGKKTLIVDDISDTGKTLQKFSQKKYFIVTLFYRRQSKVVPNIWLREKKKQWIVFPWEY